MESLRSIYNYAYDYILGNPESSLSTPNLFYNSIRKLPDNSHILDFGCGNGLVYRNPLVQKVVKEKNLRIVGIDIDEAYITRCRQVIAEVGLSSHVEIKLQDLMEYKNETKFCFAVFSESAPLMSNELIIKFSQYIIDNLLSSGGKIVFINNLTPRENTFVLRYAYLLSH